MGNGPSHLSPNICGPYKPAAEQTKRDICAITKLAAVHRVNCVIGRPRRGRRAAVTKRSSNIIRPIIEGDFINGAIPPQTAIRPTIIIPSRNRRNEEKKGNGPVDAVIPGGIIRESALSAATDDPGGSTPVRIRRFHQSRNSFVGKQILSF